MIANLLHDQSRIGSMPQNKGEPAPVVHARVAIDRDVIDVLERDAAFAQTVIDRLSGQARPMFDPAKTLFLGRGDELAVLDQTRRGIAVVSVKAEDPHWSAIDLAPMTDCRNREDAAFVLEYKVSGNLRLVIGIRRGLSNV